MAQIQTPPNALTLRPFRVSDLDDFAALHRDPDVMADLGGPVPHQAAAKKLADYIASHQQFGHGRLAVFWYGDFAGYVGVMRRNVPGHPLGHHNEIGWRLCRRMWGKGLATSAARLCLQDYFAHRRAMGVLSYALPQNTRSHRVMDRLGFHRAPELDFVEDDPDYGAWTGLVWRVPSERFRRRD